MIIKKMFDGVFDDEVHLGLLKFGRGSFKDKFLLEGKKQAKKWSVKSGPEFANALVAHCLTHLNEPVHVKGIIVSTRDLREEIDLEFDKVSNFKGVRKHKLNTEVDPSMLLEVVKSHPRTFFALSFKGDEFALKIKAEPAMKDKQSKKEAEEGPKANFCTLKTTHEAFVKELFFDVEGDFKEVKVAHQLDITDIVYPSNMEELTPTQVREQSKKKGTLTRKSLIDGEEKISTTDFVA